MAWVAAGATLGRFGDVRLEKGPSKTKGFDIGAPRLGDPAIRFKLATAAPIAALATRQRVHARDGDASGAPLLRAFCADLAGSTARQENPHPHASLADAAWVCARLGGWTGSYGKPGPVVRLAGSPPRPHNMAQNSGAPNTMCESASP